MKRRPSARRRQAHQPGHVVADGHGSALSSSPAGAGSSTTPGPARCRGSTLVSVCSWAVLRENGIAESTSRWVGGRLGQHRQGLAGVGGDHHGVEGVDLAVAVGDLDSRGRLEHRGHLGAGAYVGQAGGHLGDVLARAAGDGAPLRRAEDLQHAVVLQEGEQVARRVVEGDRRVAGPHAGDQRLHEVGAEERGEPAALEERPERLVVRRRSSSAQQPRGHPVEPRDLHQHPEVRRTQRVAPGGEQAREAERAGPLQRVVVRTHRHRHVGVLGLHPELVEEPQQVRVGALVVHDEAGVDGQDDPSSTTCVSACPPSRESAS